MSTNVNNVPISILIAIITALLTTLVIEYFAKPKLEARKERLIHNRNQIEEVIFICQELGMTLGSLKFNQKVDISSVGTYIDKQCEHALSITEELQSALPRLQLKYVLKNKKLLAGGMALVGNIIAQLYLLKESNFNHNKKLTIQQLKSIATLSESLSLMDYSLELSRHSWLHKLANRSDAEMKAKQFIKQLEDAGHKLD